jgi:C4-dicarboxylate-specific signal transduction histidine kinase
MSNDKGGAMSGDESTYSFEAFYGEITASVTHELNNVLGTIEQVAGLLEDLSLLPSGSESDVVERLGSLSEKIIRQTDRGMELVKRLNRFAHWGDQAFGEHDICELVENLVALAQRFARLQSVTLRTDLPGQPVLLVTSAVRVSEILFRCLRRALFSATADAELVVRLSARDDDVAIRLEGPCEEERPDCPQLPASQEKPPIKVVETRRDNHICIEIVVAEGGQS